MKKVYRFISSVDDDRRHYLWKPIKRFSKKRDNVIFYQFVWSTYRKFLWNIITAKKAMIGDNIYQNSSTYFWMRQDTNLIIICLWFFDLYSKSYLLFVHVFSKFALENNSSVHLPSDAPIEVFLQSQYLLSIQSLG